MPSEKIAQTFVDNGPEGTHVNNLKMQWAPKGGAPDAPSGWVNAGYVMLSIVQDNGKDDVDETGHYVELSPSDLDHLIHRLKKVRRKIGDAVLDV